MASLGNLTYNVTINDEVTKELEQLKKAVSSLQMQIAILECDKHNAEKQHNLKLEAQSPDEMFTKFKTLISESKLGGNVICGMRLGIPRCQQPFIIQDGQVYINQAFIKEGTIQFKEKQ